MSGQLKDAQKVCNVKIRRSLRGTSGVFFCDFICLLLAASSDLNYLFFFKNGEIK